MALYEDSSWSRLEKVITWSRMCTNRFAKYIGLPRAEVLYRIERGNNGLSRKLAELIVAKFPEISISWLLTGSGEMLHSMLDSGSKINYYNLDVESNIRKIGSIEPDSKIILPTSVESEFAMVYRGEAMGNNIPPNTVVILKECKTDQIIYGKEYLVVTPQMSILRVIRRATESDDVRLIAAKAEDYDDILVKQEDIESVYRVTAKLIVNY